jgi:hypothetical protein
MNMAKFPCPSVLSIFLAIFSHEAIDTIQPVVQLDLGIVTDTQ